MKKTVNKINLGENQEKVIVKIEGPECSKDTHDAFVKFLYFYQDILTRPDMMTTGANCPEKISFHHDGKRWMLEVLAFVVKGLPNEKKADEASAEGRSGAGK